MALLIRLLRARSQVEVDVALSHLVGSLAREHHHRVSLLRDVLTDEIHSWKYIKVFVHKYDKSMTTKLQKLQKYYTCMTTKLQKLQKYDNKFKLQKYYKSMTTKLQKLQKYVNKVT